MRSRDSGPRCERRRRWPCSRPTALEQTIATHVDAAIRALDPLRRRSLPHAVLAQEAPRIAALLQAWLGGVERARPPFTVASVEERMALTLAGLLLTLRVDRIDALADGGVAIIDYKTGDTDGPTRWIEARPRAPQLGLYALAYQSGRCRRNRCARSRRRGCAAARSRSRVLPPTLACGRACARRAIFRDVPFASWADIEAHWRAELEALGAEIRAGRASVTPRNVVTTCRHCKRQSLCRIGGAALDAEESGGDE